MEIALSFLLVFIAPLEIAGQIASFLGSSFSGEHERNG
jgi:hypothetical protein